MIVYIWIVQYQCRLVVFSKAIPHRRALTLREAKGLRPMANPILLPCAEIAGRLLT